MILDSGLVHSNVPQETHGAGLMGIIQNCTWHSNAIIAALSFSVKLLHAPAVMVFFYWRKIITGQYNIQLHMECIGKTLKIIGEIVELTF